MVTHKESPSDERSLPRRVWHTPLLDLLRGRIDGRLDWRWRVRSAPGIDPEFRQLGVDMLARMRVGRRRRARWVGHAIDLVLIWQISGGSALQVEEEAGGLHRLAKDAQRRWTTEEPWRVRLAWTAGKIAKRGCITLAVTYTALAIVFFTGRPVITRNFIAEYNGALAGVPVQGRAWPLYREALLKLPTVADALGSGPPWSDWPNVPLAGSHGRRALEYLENARDVIELTRRAAALPMYGRELTDAADRDLVQRAGSHTRPYARFTRSANPGLMQAMLNDQGERRELSRLLHADARAAVLAGDADRVHADITALLGMAEQADQEGLLLSQLIGLAVRTIAVRAIGEAAGLSPDLLSETQMEDLFARLSSHAGGGRADLHLDWERNSILDLAQRIFTDDGTGDGRICLQGLRELEGMAALGPSAWDYVLGPIVTHTFGSRREFVNEYDRLVGLLKQDLATPIWDRPEPGACDRAVDQLWQDRGAPRGRRLAALLLPSISKAAVSTELARLERDAALVGLAAELYRRRTGAYPESAAALASRFSGGLPPDWVDGRPLRYAVRDDRATVYSLGPDRDDDGGRLPAEGFLGTLYGRGPQRPDGDLVLWPRGSWLPDDGADR